MGEEKTTQIFTRLRWCDECNRLGNPRPSQKFLAFGTTSNAWKVLTAGRGGTIGFSPCNIVLLKVIGENVSYKFACAICHTKKANNEYGDPVYNFSGDIYERGLIDIKTWNLWLMYYDEDYRI